LKRFVPRDVSACTASHEYAQFCEGRLEDPYPLLGWLRAHDPVHFSPALDAWVITRYEDVLAGLLDRRLASDRIDGIVKALSPELGVSCAPVANHVGNWLGFTDPPKHTRMRALLRTTFTPALARRLNSRIAEIVDELLDEIADDPAPELIAALAFPLPTRIICELLGIPIEDARAFHEWSDDIAAFVGNIGPALIDIAPRAVRSYGSLDSYITKMVDTRRRCPADDVIGGLAAAECRGKLSRDEMKGLAVFTLLAGHETTVSLLGSGLRMLLEDADLRAALIADPGMVEAAVEEFLRLEPPIQFISRVTTQDVQLRGRTIPSGSLVVLHVGAANRDPEAFPQPDTVRLDRAGARHLSFGWGLHFCLGAPLARAEAAVALPRVCTRLPGLRPADRPSSWQTSMSARGLVELPTVRSSAPTPG
jgi:hypothetical protein